MIVTTPTDVWIKANVKDCIASFTISSPYIGKYFVSQLEALADHVQIKTLTRTSLVDFARGASDLDAVRKIAKRGGGICSLNGLHAKIYIIDNSKALVTSANATFSGMRRNLECGIELTTKLEISRLSELILSGFGSVTEEWTFEELGELIEPVERLRRSLPRIEHKSELNSELTHRIILPRKDWNKFVESLGGWLQLTFEGISKIPSDVFTMQQVVDICSPMIANQFPNNKFPREKLRQQMQRLRSLDIINFLGQGRYQRNIQSSR